jgi:hypothetical protein
VHAFANDPAAVVSYVEWGPNTPHETEAFLREAIASADVSPGHPVDDDQRVTGPARRPALTDARVGPDSRRQAMIDIDAIITDAERMQSVALSGESCCSVDTRAYQAQEFIHSPR